MTSRNLPIAMTLLAALAGMPGNAAHARVVKLEIIKTQSPNFAGRTFGERGAYEKIIARASGELDPADKRNAVITDIALAPKNARGMVEYTSDVTILKPVDLAKGSGGMFFEVLNRGNKLAITDFNDGQGGGAANDPTSAADAGTGFLFRLGYSVVWAGWQNENNVTSGNNRMRAAIPVARNKDGSAITKTILFEQMFDDPKAAEFELIFPAATLETNRAKMTVRNSAAATAVDVPADAWSFVDPRKVKVERQHPALAKFDSGAAYELAYEARDPDVSGIGYAITRDVVAFLRHDANAANPLRGGVRHVIAHGTSQSGRMLKGFIHNGFNEDEQGRIAFEGIGINISGAHAIELNDRFGDANATGRAYQRHDRAKIEFPFTYGARTDPVSGRTDGILARCERSKTCPKIVHTDGANEFWGKAAMLVTSDGRGRDIELPANVRYYFNASTQHAPAAEPKPGICQQNSNPNRWQPHVRAVMSALDAWVTTDTPPPASRFPRFSDGSLVPALPQVAQGFPAIPGVNYTGTHNTIGVLDHAVQPPRRIPGKDYLVRVPKVDADGNDIAGVRSVDVQVPLGTHTGWALRRAGFAENEECSLQGQFIPFAETKAKRTAAGDPRSSIEERYRNQGDYIARVVAAADKLVSQRLLLREDADRIVGAAAKKPILAAVP